MANEIHIEVNKHIDNIGTKKVISSYSKPWVNGDLSNKLNHLRLLRMRYIRHCSQRNAH